MVTIQSQCFVELSGFSDLARYACAFRQYPLRTYSHSHGTDRVLSSTLELANTLLVFYVPMEKSGRYVSYRNSDGVEKCNVVDSTKDISTYAPIINFESRISPLPVLEDDHADRFRPIKLRDLGSLARLTYDPEFPDEQNLTLFAFRYNDSWIMGYPTSLEMDEIIYEFNYIELDSEPAKPFVKYQGNKGMDPELTDTFSHGFSYLPIIRLKQAHPIFGMN